MHRGGRRCLHIHVRSDISTSLYKTPLLRVFVGAASRRDLIGPIAIPEHLLSGLDARQHPRNNEQ